MSNKSIILNTNRPGLFTPKVRGTQRESMLANRSTIKKTLKTFSNTNLESTASFRYGDKVGLLSTQQVNIDYSKFEKHTFFHSAVAKVNEAFEKIINFYPFDANNKDLEEYEDTLTGFESYVLQSFPKNVGYLMFSGTQVGETSGGTSISIVDNAGTEESSLASLKTGESLLNPGLSPFSFEFYINVPEQVNDNQVILQKISGSSIAKGMTVALSQSSETTSCSLIFGVTSGSANLYVTSSIEKGKFNHIFAGYDRSGDQKLHMFVNAQNEVTSSKSLEFKTLSFPGTNFVIASGSAVRLNGDPLAYVPKQTLSASIDELRYYRSFRSLSDIKKYQYKNLDFNRTDEDANLLFYYKFNEPYGSHSGNNIILDSSGNSFNTSVSNFHINNRLTSSLDVPVSQENLSRSPVLFPAHQDVINLNNNLMTTASLYDDFNPNLITKLVPPHYFEEANTSEDFNTVFGNFDDTTLTGGSSPGTSQIKSAQRLTVFLLIWAKFFDELKIFVDAFATISNLSYDEFEVPPGALLKKIGEIHGLKLPSLFRGANIDQLFVGVDLQSDPVKSQKPLIQIQNTIWKRILASLPYIRMTKGTLNSVKSVFRSAGLDPDNIFLIREYGGSFERRIDQTKEAKKDVIKLLAFTGSNSLEAQTLDYQGRPNKKPHLKSGYLSGSRLQVGAPDPRGTFVQKNIYPPHGISNNVNDGLFTSGSFTFEGQYRFDHKFAHAVTQSLARVHVTGTTHSSQYESAVANLIYNSGSKEITLFVVDSPKPTSATPFVNTSLVLTGVDMFDSDLWNVSFTVTSGLNNKNANSGSLRLRAGKANAGKIENQYVTSSLYNRTLDSGSPTSIFSNISELNTSGAFLAFGSQSLGGATHNTFINDEDLDPFYKTTNFTGELGSVRFWSKDLEDQEWKSHVRNPLSFGTTDPEKSYLFENAISGSFEKLRLQTFSKQFTTSSDNIGNFRFFDFSHNEKHLTGSGFEPLKTVVNAEHVIFNSITPNFDLSIADKKVRVRSLQDTSRIEENPYAITAPVYEVFPGERTLDDPRFSIDMSVMKGLNDDIVKIFSDYDFLDTGLGTTNLLFGDRYPDLIHLRNLYFNNVLDDLNLGKYRQLFKWIDNSFTDIISNLLPHTTKFMGINFVYENHMLERNRFRYYYDEIYLKSKAITSDRSLSLSQFVALIKRM